MNEEIQFPEVRVVLANPDGKDDMLGVMSRDEAIARAEDEGQDLVLVRPALATAFAPGVLTAPAF
jgi:translation initiation factor IF-3